MIRADMWRSGAAPVHDPRGLVVVVVVVFFDVGAAFADGGALVGAARDGFVVLDEVSVGRGVVTMHVSYG